MKVPDYFKFFNKTRIVSGSKALENIPYELQSMDAVKPLVITDRATVNDGVIKTLISAYGDSGCVIGGVFDGVTTYASTKTAIDAAELYRARGCDSIIAAGGEAVASVARGLNLLVSYKTDDLLQFDTLPDTINLRPFIVIPTSDSTGLETSSMCEIDGRKYKSGELMPDIVIIDPRMLKKREKSQTVITALSAMARSIEACSESDANPLNDSFAFAAIQLISENISPAVKNIRSSKNRLALANGIAMSGIVFSNAPEGGCSELAVEVAKATGHSRLLCSTILLPCMLDYKLNNMKEGVRGELLLPLGGIDSYCATPESERGEMAVQSLKKLYAGMRRYIPLDFKSLIIPEYILDNAVSAVEAGFAKRYGKDACGRILESAYAGDLSTGGSEK